MKKRDLFIGLIIGLIGCTLGCIVVIKLLTDLSITDGFNYMKNSGTIGKIITLGAIPNFILFFILLKKNKELMAKGIILSMFIITVITLLL